MANLGLEFEQAITKKIRRPDEDHFFVDLLQDGGVELRQDGPWLVASAAQVAPAAFVAEVLLEWVPCHTKLRRAARPMGQVRAHLEHALQFDRSAQDRFVAGLREHLDDPGRCARRPCSLAPCSRE